MFSVRKLASEPVALEAFAKPACLGKKVSGIKEIAKRARVHHTTVSRVLNPKTRSMVSTEVATRILRIAADLNYKRNVFASGLRTNRSCTVGVVVPDLTNPVFPPIVRAAERTLSKAGYVTIIADADNRRESERAILGSMRSHHVDGLILATALLEDELVKDCQRRNLPMVLVNRELAKDQVTSVVTDDVKGMLLVVEHLKALGHRRLAYLGGPLNTSTGLSRRKGFLAALHALELPIDERIIVNCTSFTEQAGMTGALTLLAGERGFTAIVAGNDMLALGCYAALERGGLACPADISVTGYNDMPFAGRLRPPLTSVHIRHEEIGAQAARLLLMKMQVPDTHLASVYLEPTLMVRASSGKPAK